MTHAEIIAAARNILLYPSIHYLEGIQANIARELIRLHDGAAWSSTPPEEGDCWYWWKGFPEDEPHLYFIEDADGLLRVDTLPARSLEDFSRTHAHNFWLRCEPADAALIAELRAKLARIIAQIQADQPAGSPPPGDEIALTAWVLSNLRREASAYRAELADCQRRLADAERAYDKRLAEVTTDANETCDKIRQEYDERITELEAERDALKQQIAGHCDRIAAQSEILSRRAEKPDPVCPWQADIYSEICPKHGKPLKDCPVSTALRTVKKLP